MYPCAGPYKVFVYLWQVSGQLELWAEELQHQDLMSDGAKSEQQLQIHNDSVLHMQNCTFDVLQRGQDIIQVYIFTWEGRTEQVA